MKVQQYKRWNNKNAYKKEKESDKKDEKIKDGKYLIGEQQHWELRIPDYSDRLGGKKVIYES